MKILALRGENLASLQSRFEIDFAKGRLGESGLFAITGRTGAGKSTLLDAICLALFDRMPRLQANKKNDAEIGRDDDASRLKANDVRSILSRGKSEGFAEVDFRAHDGSEWRAHWRVRRARGRADGRIQAAEHWLESIETGQRFAGKKQEIQQEVERLVGLSFEQFRRAVMLPQGEFAAFLKANADERASLLERMTGGEIYSQLSIAAHERTREEKQRLEQLQGQLGDITLIDDEAMAKLVIEIADIETEHQQSEVHVQKALGYQQSLTDHLQSHKALDEAKLASQSALLAREKAQPEVDYYAQVQAVQGARECYQALVRQRQQQQENQQAQIELKQRAAANDLALLASDDEVATQRRMDTHAKAEWEAIAPKLKQALSLETQHKEKQQQWREATDESQRQSHQVQQVQQALSGLENDLKHWQRQADQLKQQLAQHPELVAIAPRGESALENITHYRRSVSQSTDLRQQQGQLSRQKQQLQHALNGYQHEHRQLVGLREALEKRIEALSLDTLLARQSACQQDFQTQTKQLEALNQQRTMAQDWLHADTQRQQLETAWQTALAQQQEGEKQLDVLLQALKVQRATFDEAKRQFDLSRATFELADYRVLLEEEQPCPLCGSLEHPYDSSQPAVESLIHQQQARLEQLQSELQQGESQRHFLTQQGVQTERQLQQIQHEKAQLTPILSQCWQRIVALAPELAAVDQSELPTHIQVWQQQAESISRKQAELDSEFRSIQHQLELGGRWQQELSQMVQGEKQLNQDVNGVQQTLATLEERDKALRDQLDAITAQQAERATLLADIFAEYRWLSIAENDHFFQQFRLQLASVIDWQQALQSIERQLSEQQPKLTELTTQLEGGRQIQLSIEEKQASLRREINELWQQRAELVGEQSLQEIEQLHQGGMAVAEQSLKQAEIRRQSLGETRAALQKEQQLLVAQQDGLNASQQAHEQEWQQWLERYSLSNEALKALLEHDTAWREVQQEAIKALEDAVASTMLLQKEREQRLEQQHSRLSELKVWLGMDESDDLALLESQLSEHLEKLQGIRKQQSNLLFEAKRRLHDAETAKKQAGELEQQWMKQHAVTETWLKLNELIGSATGSKFRTLAQGLTLQQLVLVANTHLSELSPRYALQPVPGSPLALQVIDHDMGDEVRSVESLSGGETFLLSLSLALALASLAADTRQLGSLFIDEGFGTLDPESLEMALSCLDALQANGRQIGVISHVSTLVERIGVQVAIEAKGSGRSEVRVKG
ncbi:AAA family ATPase [Thaumasiovibrio subtropicus]|uniref:AAA family ATPase n=1 Tax=Thaumasiovibrio subtropicus TaxID=1891207 RepID=UPI000B363F8A|nr:AAA family ATPase [Thaumasiovibrio subtropicus]